MNAIKKNIYLLYRMTAKLNLYASRGIFEKNRVLNEMQEIKALAEEIIKDINNQNPWEKPELKLYNIDF